MSDLDRQNLGVLYGLIIGLLLLPIVALAVAASQPPVVTGVPSLVQNVPTLAPEKPSIVDEVLSSHCDGWEIFDTQIVDGDTWDCQVEKRFGLGWKICTDGRKRLRGDWDAWEASRDRRFDGKCATDEELVKGRKAADAFDEQMSKASRKFVLFIGDGAFSRDKVRLFWIQESGDVIEAGPWMKQHKHDRGES